MIGTDPPSYAPVYKEKPCECGYTYENEPDNFEIYNMRMGKYLGAEILPKAIPRCKICKTISILIREEEK